MTCKYPDSKSKCEWEIDGNIITVKNGGSKHQVTLTKKGIVLADHVFEKLD